MWSICRMRFSWLSAASKAFINELAFCPIAVNAKVFMPPKVCLKPNGLSQCQTFFPFLGIFFVFSGKGFCLRISVFQVFAFLVPL